MTYSDIPSAQTLVLYFKSRGVKNIVISPGSRNAPLTISFTKNPFFKCYSIVDERCAAFFAMGMAQHLQEPVAVICSSGSAILNFYPAVAEAFYSDIPLIVVSADRPSYRIDIGDGQTIRQENILEKHIGYSANLKQDVSHATDAISKFSKSLLNEKQEEIQSYNEREIAKALALAFDETCPVHINVPFEEPLYGRTEEPSVQIKDDGKYLEQKSSSEENWVELAKVWNNSARKLVLVGVNQPSAIEAEVLESLAQDPNTLVFTETTSNLHHPEFFESIDSIIAPIEKSKNREKLFTALQPELLVTFGGLIVSKKIKAFLREYKPKQHWHIDSKKANDTFYCLTRHIKTNPNLFFKKIVLENSNPASDYKAFWESKTNKYEAKRDAYLKKIPFSDFSVFDRIIENIPKGYQVHLANSSTVRYAQLFPLDASLKVFCNRGTSGIDGTTSTAVGSSIYSKEPTVLFTGDLSFFYDSNALWNNYIRPDFRIVLINNSGGGIFRILPGMEETEEFETFFETNHELSAQHLANMYGFEHITAQNQTELKQGLAEFYSKSDKPKILEVTTPRVLNNKILLGYFDFIS
ncbi:2-succinyl-5-enolpyruvyl-6-hydroxy-3-cyclohexene-1-carboxylic-acid synthase [Flagellimonas halotolerans]|uniref:2-succinyl-5-enolpyruvyl-6-hydroxy-3-cyclohexene-1-carboxylate synthase n=1 Tax=Flagellimonas halotolerans TaxID=3112164 RepID=A0ABU6INR7_9FLAO|nr:MULTISPECIES: 2-succinyl-5-enolpyruvyl-6-hydroxy-3-cyclohexene-1-carboxylic-acid synthase [unclassified Allomuricauda]MEC3964736.1 2-succinyl-5-enolpyruvyl-6-hydroxy-3-cyclohexene-1-carboxylic-acid synthase [Muricauda sp. SYSU M86414]MEC4264605.1 2-succinyl-5-enolpyruvyl-6-hydroxy-3-cyclohexene-1-carboxylic-acid synthase [Muricauda sp. SYSU M84420]